MSQAPDEDGIDPNLPDKNPFKLPSDDPNNPNAPGWVAGDNPSPPTFPAQTESVNANGTGSEVTPGDISGAQGRFLSEYGSNDANGAGLAAYKAARASGQGHEAAYQTATKALKSGGGSGGGGGGGQTSSIGGQQATPTPTPDNSGLNSLIQQLLTNQSTAASAQAAQRAEQDKFRGNIVDTVNGIVKNNSGVASASDPTIAGAVGAFKGEGEQAMRQAQEASAARARAEGQSTGALDSAISGGYDTLGQNTGAYSAGLVNSENNNRRQALLGASNIGAGIVNADDSNALQDKISSLNAALSASQTQGGQAVDWATLLQKPLLASIAAGPGNASAGAQLLGVNNQNSQFYDKLGIDQANTDNMSNLLGSLLLSGA